MKIVIWVKEESLESLKTSIHQYNNSIPNQPPKFFTFNPGNEYLTVMIDYDTFVALQKF